ncbi:MAG: carboxypeptidase-like regulatory domain-containing protein, partial [Gemmatimonadaceae bacterium]|nr:carboxypeptidase-like regulatory domain-containing protein [Chitinophagaceae bacterium]
MAQSKLIRGYIKDALSDERVPFASISFQKTGGGKLSDSAGNFAFRLDEWPNDTLEVTYVGYKDYKIYVGPDQIRRAVNNELQLVISLDRGKIVSEVIVKRKIDRGLLMWKRIVRRKPANDRYRFNNFSYELYNKLELDINRINREKMKQMGLLKPFNFIFDNVDTSEGQPFLPVFLTETISDYYCTPKPFRSREIIKGSKT